MVVNVVPATGSVENGSNGLSLNGLCRVVLNPIVNRMQQAAPTPIVNGSQPSVPTLIGNGRQQPVQVSIVPTAIANAKQQPVQVSIVPTAIGNAKQQPLQPNPMSMTSIPAVFINANSIFPFH